MSKITKNKLISRNFINVGGGVKKAGTAPSVGISSSVVRSIKTFARHQAQYIPTDTNTEPTFIQISAGWVHSLALKSDGTLWAWGSNGNGQFGNGTTSSSNVPIKISNLTDMKQISAGNEYSLGLKNDGTLLAWGMNNVGQLGDGSTSTRISPVQIKTNIMQISAGRNGHSLALDNDGTVWAWGRNNFGQLGINNGNFPSSTPVRVVSTSGSGTLTGITQISVGDNYSLALKVDTNVFSWGLNAQGQLGNNIVNVNSSIPVQVIDTTGSGTLSGISQVSCGAMHAFALKPNGTVIAWGHNTEGELGDGTNVQKNFPITLSTINNVKQISGGNSHSLGLQNDGTVWAWGFNATGQVGDGTNTQRLSPVKVLNNITGKQISAGQEHSISLQINGTILAWGNNIDGRLGDGTTTNSNIPVKAA